MRDSEDEDDPMPLINSPAAKSVSKRGCFLNAGNTCYISATLQLLLHVPTITAALSSFKGGVGSALQILNAQHQKVKLVRPDPILRVITKISSSFVKNEQQDAHEFLVKLLDKLAEEAQATVTPVHSLFGSTTAELVSCEKCSCVSSTEITFPMVVTVPFNGFNDIQEAVNDSLNPEFVECTCTDCGHNMKKKVSCLLMPANFLCMHIPRFKFENETSLKSHNDLYISNSLVYAGHKYTLLSVIVHHGVSLSSGHYTAFCRDRTNIWYHFNDSRSIPVNILSYLESEECLQNAYIILYEKDKVNDKELSLQSLSQLMSKAKVSNECDPPPSKTTRRKLLQDPKEQEIPSKKQKLEDKESVNNQKTRSIGVQTDPQWSYEAMSRGPQEKFKYFTGVTPGEFEVIYDLLGGDAICSKLKYNFNGKTPLRNSTTIKISIKSRLFLVLMRMRRGFSVQDVCEFMNISAGHVSAIFYTWVRLLSINFKRLSHFMLISAEKQNERKPSCFLPFKNLKIVIDCAEFQIERSSNMHQQGNCYSEYKHYASGKVCFAISCYGGISLVSDVYEGRISDKKLVLDMGLLEKLKKGDVIMADRGFKIEEECIKKGLILLKPPEMSGGREHLSPREEVMTKSIACVRIYVEHVIGRVKDWKLLQHRVELLLVDILPDMIVIASFIHNFSKSYIK